MARNFRELQERMDESTRASIEERVQEELRRMALDELRSAKRLTQSDMAELLNVPQSSISRIEQRADMYLSTLRNYVRALGGALQIQAVFPDGGKIVIDKFGDYDDRTYLISVHSEHGRSYRLTAKPLDATGSPGPDEFSTRLLKAQGLTKALKALLVPDPQIAGIRHTLTEYKQTEIFGRAGVRVFKTEDLITAGFDVIPKPGHKAA